jgi:beta-glucanase (GH16 family)
LQDGNFHTAGLAWTPDGYTVYLDGVVIDSVPASVPVSAAPEYIILSSEVTSNFPPGGYGSKSDSAATFDVDWVRVYPLATPEPSTTTLVTLASSLGFFLAFRRRARH